MGYLADRLIAATAKQILAIELAQGTIQWKYTPAKVIKESRAV